MIHAATCLAGATGRGDEAAPPAGLATRARAKVGLDDPRRRLHEMADQLTDLPGRTLAQQIGDTEHRVEVRRAWRRTEALVSLVAATVAAVAVIAVLPTPTPSQAPRPAQPGAASQPRLLRVLPQ